jgi:hypothetical protein
MSARIQFPLWPAFLGLIILCCAAAAGEERSRFAGSYSGKFVYKTPNVEEPQEGVFDSTVDENGHITGKGTNTTAEQTAKHTGTIDEDGRVKLIFAFPYATYTAVGTASKTKNGTIIATLIQKSGTKMMGTIQLELAPKHPPKK